MTSCFTAQPLRHHSWAKTESFDHDPGNKVSALELFKEGKSNCNNSFIFTGWKTSNVSLKDRILLLPSVLNNFTGPLQWHSTPSCLSDFALCSFLNHFKSKKGAEHESIVPLSSLHDHTEVLPLLKWPPVPPWTSE